MPELETAIVTLPQYLRGPAVFFKLGLPETEHI